MSDVRLDLQQAQKLSQGLQTALRLLALDLDELSAEMNRAVMENPALEFVPPKRSPREYAVALRARWGAGRFEGLREEIPSPRSACLEDLEHQLAVGGLAPDVEKAARQMLHLLSSRGYFLQEPEEFARDAGIPEETACGALAAVQALEPAGVGARDVRECLLLQLKALPEADPLCALLVKEHLPAIGRGAEREIAKALKTPLPRVRACVETIRGLTPVPCSLSEEIPVYILPEFTVEAGAGGALQILFHNDYYPEIRQDPSFIRLSETLSGEEAAFARKMTLSAGTLIHAVELRRSTMEKVARIITREQESFFLGSSQPVPLHIQDAAAEIGVHETTVYRAIQNKYLDCARGTFPLNFFFQREVAAGVSAEKAKERVREICREKAGVSDRVIAELLEAEGMKLSRRTVAKYRAQMEISSSFARGNGKDASC